MTPALRTLREGFRTRCFWWVQPNVLRRGLSTYGGYDGMRLAAQLLPTGGGDEA